MSIRGVSSTTRFARLAIWRPANIGSLFVPTRRPGQPCAAGEAAAIRSLSNSGSPRHQPGRAESIFFGIRFSHGYVGPSQPDDAVTHRLHKLIHLLPFAAENSGS